MPRSKRIAAYPPEYEIALCRAAADGYLLLPLPSAPHAKTLRGKFYGYFAALRAEGSRPDLCAKSDALSLTVVGTDLQLSAREDAWDAQLLRDTLGVEKGSLPPPAPAPPTVQDLMRARLAEIRSARLGEKPPTQS